MALKRLFFNRKIKNATPFEFDGITFRSKFECDVYKALKENGFHPLYEAEKVILFNGFRPKRCWYQDGIPIITPKGKLQNNLDEIFIKAMKQINIDSSIFEPKLLPFIPGLEPDIDNINII